MCDENDNTVLMLKKKCTYTKCTLHGQCCRSVISNAISGIIFTFLVTEKNLY